MALCQLCCMPCSSQTKEQPPHLPRTLGPTEQQGKGATFGDADDKDYRYADPQYERLNWPPIPNATYDDDAWGSDGGISDYRIGSARIADLASPDGHPPQLSGSLAAMFSIDGSIIVTWANYALWDFVKSWARHAANAGEHVPSSSV